VPAERHAVIDEVLRQDARDHRLADAAFFAADEMQFAHAEAFVVQVVEA